MGETPAGTGLLEHPRVERGVPRQYRRVFCQRDKLRQNFRPARLALKVAQRNPVNPLRVRVHHLSLRFDQSIEADGASRIDEREFNHLSVFEPGRFGVQDNYIGAAQQFTCSLKDVRKLLGVGSSLGSAGLGNTVLTTSCGWEPLVAARAARRLKEESHLTLVYGSRHALH